MTGPPATQKPAPQVRRKAAKGEPSRTALVRRARRINKELAELYPDAHTELDFTTPLELLVATILSAQTTDKRRQFGHTGPLRQVPDRRRPGWGGP